MTGVDPLVEKYFEQLRARIEAGAEKYGDQSFALPVDEILAELQCEALDLAGWGYVLWLKIERIRNSLDSTIA